MATEGDVSMELADEKNGVNLTRVIEYHKLSYEDKLKFVTPISKPLASEKLCKKVLKLIQKAKLSTTKESACLRYGLKNVQKRILLGDKGVVVIAGNVTPIDVLAHFPILCEDNNLPYCFVPTRSDIGAAMGMANRGPVIVLVKTSDTYQELYDSVYGKLKTLPCPL